MTDLATKQLKIYDARNRLIRDSIKSQLKEKGKWDVDLVMDALGLEPDTAYGKAVEAFIWKHGRMIEDAVIEELREEVTDRAEQERLRKSHQPTIISN